MAVPAAIISISYGLLASARVITRVSSQSERFCGSWLPPANALITKALLLILFDAGNTMSASICCGAVIMYFIIYFIFYLILHSSLFPLHSSLNNDWFQVELAFCFIACSPGVSTILLWSRNQRTVVHHVSDSRFLLCRNLVA